MSSSRKVSRAPLTAPPESGGYRPSSARNVPALAPGVDDVLDAAVVARTAQRVASGEARPLPDPPETFSDGIPCAIWV